MSLISDFHKHSQDFLKLLGEKSRRANNNKSIAEELGVLEFYHDGLEAFFRKYEQEIGELAASNLALDIKGKLLEIELEKLMKHSFEQGLEMPKKPTTTQFNMIKKKYEKREVSTYTVMSHFLLSDDQLRELLNVVKS